MPEKLTKLTLNLTEKLSVNASPDILFINSMELPTGEIMPGIILFNAPPDYIPIRAFIYCSDLLTNFVIQDSEQTEIFVAAQIQAGYSCLNLKNGICPPFLPTLNLSCQGNNEPGLRVIIEYHRFPL